MRLHAQEDGVGGETGEAALHVRLAAQLLCLRIQVVEGPNRLLKLLLVHLEERERERETPPEAQTDSVRSIHDV